MNLQKLKERLAPSIETWIDARIDDMIKGNPSLAIPSVYMKRAAHNIVCRNKEEWEEKIDKLSLFVADENGVVDAESVFDDAMQILKAMEKKPFDIGVLHGTIGDGCISIDMPDGIISALLFGSNKSIAITTDDIAELKNILIT